MVTSLPKFGRQIRACNPSVLAPVRRSLIDPTPENKAENYGDMPAKDDVQLIYWPENALLEFYV